MSDNQESAEGMLQQLQLAGCDMTRMQFEDGVNLIKADRPVAAFTPREDFNDE